jgi:hypothetical protein
MQKHHFIFLFSFLLIFSVSEAALAAIISLPRYQGSIAHKYTDRTQSGGKDKVEVSCSSRGGYAKGANQTCTGLFMVNGQTCYKSCTCSDGYKANASGTCVAKTCSDYGLKSSPDATMSCKSVSKAPNLTCHECVACDTSVYKYACSGGLMPRFNKEARAINCIPGATVLPMRAGTAPAANVFAAMIIRQVPAAVPALRKHVKIMDI